MTNAWLTCSSLRSRHFEVVGERENGRARGRQVTRAVSFTIDKSIRKNQKQRNIQRFFNATASANLSDYNYCTYFYFISVFLHTVIYFIKKWFIVTNFTLARLFRNPAISNFFPFPLGLRNSGVQLYTPTFPSHPRYVNINGQRAKYWVRGGVGEAVFTLTPTLQHKGMCTKVTNFWGRYQRATGTVMNVF